MIYLDDSIMLKGKPATAGSKILSGFLAPFDSAVAERLCGAEIESLALGEFGLEAPGELPEGSLLCNDIFGHVRIAADNQGLSYIRPTYGTVSRYGLIPAACSMDQIGVACRDAREGFELLAKIAGHDERDGAMFPEKSYSYAPPEKTVRVIEYDKIANAYTALGEQVLRVLACAEISNNISRYDGIKFGYRAAGFKGLNDLYLKTRTEGFGTEAKLAAIMGSMLLSQEYYKKYYDKAMRLRRIILDAFDFKDYDVVALPVNSPIAVLCGYPSLTFSGVQLMAAAKNESVLLGALEVRGK